MNERAIAEGNLESIRDYLQEDYWESGHDKKVSGYQNSYINWWWVNRWMQCFTSVFTVRDKKVLDLGCGYGSMVAGLVTWGADAYGIDISDYAIEKGKKEADYLRNRIFQGSIHDLSRFEDNSFDLIYSNQVFEHLPEAYVEQLISEMMRVCRPGAKLWLAFVISEEENGTRGEDDPDMTHINIHSMDWWRRRFFAAGFTEKTRINTAIAKRFLDARVSVAITAAAAVGLASLGSFSYSPQAILGISLNGLITVLDFALLGFIFLIALRMSNLLIMGLTALQVLGMVYLDFFLMDHGTQVTAGR